MSLNENKKQPNANSGNGRKGERQKRSWPPSCEILEAGNIQLDRREQNQTTTVNCRFYRRSMLEEGDGEMLDGRNPFIPMRVVKEGRNFRLFIHSRITLL